MLWDWHEAIAPQSWSNWALVLVGVGGIWAALRTLRAIRRQARSMRRQTTILRNNVNALIASERAWVDGGGWSAAT